MSPGTPSTPPPPIRPPRPAPAHPVPARSQARRFTALVNPVSGDGRAEQRWAGPAGLLRRAGAVVRTERTRDSAHATEAAKAAAEAGDVVVAVGGDGLVRDVAQGVVAAGGTMGIVPAGRGNDLARRLGLPASPRELARVLLEGRPRAVDVIEVGEGTIVVGNVYAGVDSAANLLVNELRGLPPLLLYRLAPVWAMLRWRVPRYTLTLDGRSITLRGHTVSVANSGTYGHGLRMVPQAVLDDGVLRVMTVDAVSRHRLVPFMLRARKGTHTGMAGVRIVTAREVVIAADRPVPLYGDGEDLGELPARLRVRPGALNLLSPA
ncbi:diacylglycerol kinase family protein [Marinactinospora endophytica]